MKYLKIFFFIIISFFVFGCNGNKEPEVKKLEYDLKIGETLEYTEIASNITKDLFIGNYLYIEITDAGILATSEGVEVISIMSSDEKYLYNITITIQGSLTKINVDDEFVIRYLETKEIEFTVEGASSEDVELITYSSNLTIEGFNITANELSGGTVYLQVKNKPETKVAVKVVVESIDLLIKNESMDIDFFDEFVFDLEYPEYITDEVTFKSSNERILTVDENGKVYPKGTGTAKVTIKVGNHSQLRETVQLTITVNPVDVIEKLHIDNVVMQKDVVTYYGSPFAKQDVYGSVSNYLFGEELNIITTTMADIDTNKYTGKTANKTIIEELDAEQKYVRPGVYLEKLEYIIYHDTGNPKAGADGIMNINWMNGQWNTRARSWHYIVEERNIYQTIPDNEVAWQGDSYEAYAKSIGVETCIVHGMDLFKVWRTTGKLMASLMYKYNLKDDCIKQHYEIMEMAGSSTPKDCPQTLRHADLYDEALELVAGELLYLRTMKDYTVTFKSLTPEFLDDTGKIIKNPSSTIKVEYEVTITNGKGYNETVKLSSTVKPVA